MLLILNDEVEKFTKRKGFICTYFLNSDYEEVQSTSFSNNYKGLGYSQEILDSVKETPWQPEMWGGKEYNTKFNPGRSILTDSTWLKVGWKMWFGEGFYEIVSKDKILSFANSIEIKELDNSIVYLQLFDKLTEPYTSDAVNRQWEWVKWMDYSGLEKKNEKW